MCIYIHAYMYIYMYYIYRCFCNELKVFIKYLLKKQTHSFPRCPFLSPLKPVFLPLPISSHWASCFECWENTVVILFSVFFFSLFLLYTTDVTLA